MHTGFSRLVAACAVLALGAALTLPAAAADSMMSSSMDRYGGPAYMGAPNLSATVALVMAGGGPAHFSFASALTSMAGANTVNAEVSKLDKQYGKANVQSWLKTWDFAVNDVLRQVKAANITLPAPAPVHGKALAVALVKAGLKSNGTYWTGLMLDHAVSHKIHDQTMDDIDKAMGQTADANYHRITNQAMFDLAHALGANSVQLAAFH